jgi:hypothetical protein
MKYIQNLEKVLKAHLSINSFYNTVIGKGYVGIKSEFKSSTLPRIIQYPFAKIAIIKPSSLIIAECKAIDNYAFLGKKSVKLERIEYLGYKKELLAISYLNKKEE